MLNDHHGIPAIRKSVKNFHQLMHVRKMKSRGRFIQNIYCFPCAAPAQLRGQLNSLCFSPRKCGGRLPKLHISQTHIIEGLDFPANGRQVLKKGKGLLHRHIQHIKNILSFIFHIQRLPVVAPAAADFAGHIYIWQKMHLYLDNAIPAAGLAAAAFYIEAEPSLAVALGLGIRGGGKQIPDLVKYSRISSRIGTGRAPYGRLVDGDHLIQLLQTRNSLMLSRNTSGTV